ncbi:hypothetical protein B566_EDAN000766, partial [Ephemera danica]
MLNCSVSGGGEVVGLRDVTFLKDGRPVVSGGRISITEGGRLLTVHGVSRVDRGMYQCLVRSGEDNAQGSAELSLGAVAPELHSTFIAQTLQPGPSVSLRCTASGSPPPRVSWLLDGVELGGSAGLVLGSFLASGGDVVSHLNVTSVRVHHGGLYTCVATNSAGSAAYSAPLNVYGPPSARPPRNLTVVAGTDVYLRCPVAGFPISSVTWRRGEVPLPSHTRQRVFPNGTLLVRGVEGEPPEIAPFQFPTNLREGMRAQVSCSIISGDFPIAISWRKDGGLLIPEPDVAEQQHQFVSNLLFMNLAARHSGQYTCIASNAAATANYTARLVVRAEDFSPLLPGPRLFLASNGSVVIHAADSSHQGQYMCQASNGIGSGLSKSIFLRVNGPQVRSLSTAQVREVATAGGGVSAELHLAALTRRDAGAYRCMASNEFGEDEMLVHLHVKEAPSRVSLMETGSRSLTLSWSAPYSGHAAISHYVVQYREQLATLPASNVVPSSPESAWHNVTAGGGARSARIAALRPATAYLLRVVAVNEVGAGPASHPPLLAVTTQEAPSGPPVDVTADASSPEILHVRWKPPLQGFSHGEILGYQVAYREVGGSETTQQTRRVRGRNRLDVSLTGLRQFTRYQLTVRAFNRVGAGSSTDVEVKKTTNLETNLHGLTHYANYSLRVAAFTAAGDGERSSPIHCTTEEDVPGPPEHVKALEVVKEVVFGDRELMYEARRLKEFSRYEFYVTACTSVGEGQPSPKVSQSPVSRVPARIASFTRRFVVAAGQVLSLPCLAVGMPAPERSWRALGRTVTTSDSPALRVLPDGSLSLAAVRSGDHGNYTCLAENVYGRDEIHYELAVQLPPGAPLLSMLGTASHALTLQWRLPDDGGSPVTGFWLSYRREGGEWQQMTLDPDRRSVQLDRLACGTPYVLQIAAGNAVGRGKPGPALSVNSTCATLFLDAWPAGGCPLTHFSVEVREARAAAAWELVSSLVPPTQPELTLRDLQPARWYAVRVSAHSDAGAATHEFLFATRNEAGEMVLPEMEPERPGPQQGVSFTDPTVVVPILSGMICTAAAA